MTLDELGPRICILGPSGSGKSTLAQAIARARGLAAIHLDQLHHLPDTDWQPRPQAEFVALHDAAIQVPSWVIEGNYSRCLPQRLDRATGVIRLETPTLTSLYRYFRRSWFESGRAGALEGGRDSVKWLMIHHILVTTRLNRGFYDRVFGALTHPKLQLSSPRELAAFYAQEGLDR